MVTPDWSAPPKPAKKQFEKVALRIDHAQLARPIDRAAAVIVDVCVVLAPIFYLLSSPLRSWMTSSFLIGSEADFVTTVAGMTGIAVGLLIAYQTIMHFFFRATLGKMLFDLQIVSMFEGERLSAWDCFIRAWFWVAQTLCFGLPFLAVFSNSKRRPLHDRVCDTLVVSRVAAGVAGPARWEQFLVRGTFAVVLMLALVVALVQIRGITARLKAESGITAMTDVETGACEVVGQHFDPETEESDVHARLKLAMNLYAAGMVDRNCLEAEVEREIATQTPVGPLTYLAQAFIHAADAEVSNEYLDEVCKGEENSAECQMSKVVSRWSEEDWDGVEQAITAAPAGSGYVEVWGVRHYMRQAHYSKALTMLDSLIQTKALADFNLEQRVKALYNSYRAPEAEAALAQAVTVLPDEEGRDLSSWVCAQQLQTDCEAVKSTACKIVHAGDDQTSEIDFEHSNEALARVLALECRNGGKMDYMSFAEAVQSEDWQTFFRANSKMIKNDVKASNHLFSSLMLSPEASDLLKVEAARRWARAADAQEIKDVYEQWRDIPSREVWVKAGNMLVKRMNELGDLEAARKVARFLVNSDSLSPQTIAILTGLGDDENRRPAGSDD